jgi:D-amino peptidase
VPDPGQDGRRHSRGGEGGGETGALEFDAEHLAMAATVVPGVTRVGERKVAYTHDTMYDGIRTFKAVTTIVSAAVEEQYG